MTLSDTLRWNLRVRCLRTPPSPFDVVYGAMQRTREIDVEQRAIQTVDDSDFGEPNRAGNFCKGLPFGDRIGGGKILCRLVHRRVLSGRGVFWVVRALLAETQFVVTVFSCSRCGIRSPNFGHAEDGLPSLEFRLVRRRVAETSVHQCSLGPTISDACNVPLGLFG